MGWFLAGAGEQIGQPCQHIDLAAVLGQATQPGLLKAELLLDHPERVLDLGADMCLGRFDLAAQRRHQFVHLAGGDAEDVGVHHHSPQGAVDPAAGFQEGREEAAGAEARDAQLNVIGRRRQEPVMTAVAVSTALCRALLAIGTQGGSGLSLDLGLQTLAHQFRDEFTSGAAPKQLHQLAGGKIGNGNGLVSERW
jgi:hypothetical protein